MNKVSKLAEEIRKIAYEMEVFGIDKEAAAPRLFEYEMDGFKFFMDTKMPAGVRLPVGKAKYTKNYYPTSGALSKDLKEESGNE